MLAGRFRFAVLLGWVTLGAWPLHSARADEALAQVHVEPDAQQRLGLEFRQVQPSRTRDCFQAIGVLSIDPARSYRVRAPIAGYLRVDANEWPEIGARVGLDRPLATIEPRFSPLDQLTIHQEYVSAQSSVAEQQSELTAARASYESKLRLNTEQKLVSDRELEDAEERLRVAEARLAAAQAKLAMFEEQQNSPTATTGEIVLTSGRGGEVVEVLAGPDEAVESGEVLLRLARLDRLIARVQLAPGERWTRTEDGVQLALVGNDDVVLDADVVGLAPSAGSLTAGETWLLAVDAKEQRLRPDMPVKAFLPRGDAEIDGFDLPMSAIVRYAGGAWVFVRIAEDAFEQRPVELLRPTRDGWFVIADLRPDEAVVTTGAQMLLSQMLEAEIEREEEAAE